MLRRTRTCVLSRPRMARDDVTVTVPRWRHRFFDCRLSLFLVGRMPPTDCDTTISSSFLSFSYFSLAFFISLCTPYSHLSSLLISVWPCYGRSRHSRLRVWGSTFSFTTADNKSPPSAGQTFGGGLIERRP